MNTVDHMDVLAGVLGPALHCIQAVVPSELAAVYDLREGRLEARSIVGSLRSRVVAQRHIEVTRHPSLRPALDDGTPLRLPARELLGPAIVGSSPDRPCVLVPLRCGDECLGALVLVGDDEAFHDASAVVAAGHGLAAALAVARGLEASSPLGSSLMPLRKAERLHLLAALKHTGGKIYGRDGAARLLDLKPTTLQSKLKKHGISRLDVVDGSASGNGSSGSPDDGTTTPRSEGTPSPSGSSARAAPASRAAE